MTSCLRSPETALLGAPTPGGATGQHASSTSRPCVPAGLWCGLWTRRLAGAGRQQRARGVQNEALVLGFHLHALREDVSSDPSSCECWALFPGAADVVTGEEVEGAAPAGELRPAAGFSLVGGAGRARGRTKALRVRAAVGLFPPLGGLLMSHPIFFSKPRCCPPDPQPPLSCPETARFPNSGAHSHTNSTLAEQKQGQGQGQQIFGAAEGIVCGRAFL